MLFSTYLRVDFNEVFELVIYIMVITILETKEERGTENPIESKKTKWNQKPRPKKKSNLCKTEKEYHITKNTSNKKTVKRKSVDRKC